MIKFGIVGLGEAGTLHCNNLKTLRGVQLIGIYDPYKKQSIETLGITSFNKLTNLIDDVDAIIICSPSFTHADIAQQVILRKKHIFLEKPIDIDLKKAKKLLNMANHYKKVIQMGFVLRFGSGRNKLRKIIQRGTIGRPVCYIENFAITGGANAQWVHNIDQGGGMVVEGISHAIDWGRYTFGEIKSSSANLMKIKPGKFTAPDTGNVCIKFKFGDMMIITFSWSLPGTGWKQYGEREFKIAGPKGCVTIYDFEMELNLTNGRHSIFDWPDGWGAESESYKDEIKHFIKCIEGTARPISTLLDGYKALESAQQALSFYSQ